LGWGGGGGSDSLRATGGKWMQLLAVLYVVMHE
jgi:hypothetical protein